MSLASRLQGITALVAGDALVREDDLKNALGGPAWHVWQVLLRVRAADGETHITHRGIMHARGFVPMKHRNDVNRAMRRLEAAKLVQPIGKVFRVVPSRSGAVERQVYVRNVRGSRLLRMAAKDPAECAVPTVTRAWIAMPKTHGGTRVGAGRTRLAINAEKESRCVSARPPQKNQDVSPIEIMSKRSSILVSGRGFSSPSEKRDLAAASAAVQPSIREEATAVGAVLSGTATRRVGGLADPIPGVPLYPGHSIVTPAAVPPAPLLDPDGSPVVHATMLARAYRGAIEKRFGRQKRPILARGDISRSKHFAMLTEFAAELIRHEIAPAAWCIHRVDKWRKATKGKQRPTTPTISWVFSLAAIADDRRWHFRAEYERGNLGGRLVFSKAHLRLLAIYNAMHADLRRMRKADAVEKHFPNGLYDELVDHARRDAAETSHRLSGDVARGRHVW